MILCIFYKEYLSQRTFIERRYYVEKWDHMLEARSNYPALLEEEAKKDEFLAKKVKENAELDADNAKKRKEKLEEAERDEKAEIEKRVNCHSLFDKNVGYSPVKLTQNDLNGDSYKKIIQKKKFNHIFSSSKINFNELRKNSWMGIPEGKSHLIFPTANFLEKRSIS